MKKEIATKNAPSAIGPYSQGIEASGPTVKTTVLLADIKDFGPMNEIYGEFFKGVCPARACFQVAALPKGALVEIEAFAVK